LAHGPFHGEVAEFDVAELGFELYLLFATGRRVARFAGEILSDLLSQKIE